jgi:hypothetical protein
MREIDEIAAIADMKAGKGKYLIFMLLLSSLKDGRFFCGWVSLNGDQVWQLIVKYGLRVKFCVYFVVVTNDRTHKSKNTFTSIIRHVNHN